LDDIAAEISAFDTSLRLNKVGANQTFLHQYGHLNVLYPTLLIALLISAKDGQAEIVRAFLVNGIDHDAENFAGRRALILVAGYNGNVNIMDLLVPYGAEIHRMNVNGDAPLHVA